ncbi:Cdc6-related protein AAA superfamily ATPase- like protein [Salinarchaeum sp. Harcht-Bsk1]|uniref:AAA family ATPase n=1 Tax=Salinarchaeum sp. Harcht-Bsk1 TaxID=1333523 RepID=UPI0003423F98|nr:AAA family ATPase [Salinarchaeum sp. Harcht-Bsk1]AGN02056.1 Cdc6-related protein AAA superfamily ATPase- like protein [Salinarchaeum sp. Harcht-Bsk1]
MDLSERIERRQMRTRDDRLLLDRSLLSPTVHLDEPVGRAPALESLLDAVEPVFEGRLPPTLAVAGPAGVGKSAVVGSLFRALDQRLGVGGSIATTTRGGSPQRSFATVDCRHAPTPFRFYRQLLCQLGDAEVPAHGVGTARLREEVIDQLGPQGRWAVIAVDHVAEAADLDPTSVRELLDPVADSVSLTWVGRSPPVDAERTVRIEPYRHHALTDVLAHRCSRAARTDAFDHDDLRTIAARKEGNAHDALAVALGAALLAEAAGDSAIDREHLTAASAAVPEGTVHLDAVLALPENRRRVLAELLRLDPAPTVGEAARDIADQTDLTAGTVRRFCYELSDAGVLARHGGDADARGRDPSHLTPAFPWLAFAGVDDVLSVADVRDRVEREAAPLATW